MIAACLSLFLLVVNAAAPGAFLSIFGSDSNDGLTQATAVKTLLRAAAVMTQNKFGIIYVLPGSYPMQTITLSGNVAIVGLQGQASVTKFSCQQGQAYFLSNSAATISFDSIMIEGCNIPVQLGYASGYPTITASFYNMIFTGNADTDIFMDCGVIRVWIENSQFVGGSNGLRVRRGGSSYASSYDIQILNSKFSGYTTSVVSLDNMYYSSSVKVNLNVTTSQFKTGTGQAIGMNMASNVPATLTMLASTFSGSNDNCGVVLGGSATQATITKSTFSGKTGGSPLCVLSSATVTTMASEFSNNTITQATSGGAVFVKSAVYATSSSLYRGNTMAMGSGAGIHSESSHLTVAQCTFNSNSAPDAPAASCDNTVLVAYGNTQSRNSGSSMNACAI